jgi:hypothetical protein
VQTVQHGIDEFVWLRRYDGCIGGQIRHDAGKAAPLFPMALSAIILIELLSKRI